MITCKSQQSSYKILRGKGTQGRPPLLLDPSCKEGDKTAWFALKGLNCFSNEDKHSLDPEWPQFEFSICWPALQGIQEEQA